MVSKTCQEEGHPEFELQRSVNIPDWETCSILCWANQLCTDGWHYSVTGKLCILYSRCTHQVSDENNLVGNRNCHATRKQLIVSNSQRVKRVFC